MEMDDEEMAEEYIKVNNLEWELECNRTSPIGEVKQAYLAGLKAGRPEWHDLRKASNDLPKPNMAVLICLRVETWTATYIAYYRPAMKKWQMYNLSEAQRQPVADDYIDMDEVIAWCEIPKFTDEAVKDMRFCIKCGHIMEHDYLGIGWICPYCGHKE
jgi:hypothetical protein